MNRNTLIIAFAALVVGFGAGFASRPVLTAQTDMIAASGLSQPTEAEATAAVRRYKVGFRSIPMRR